MSKINAAVNSAVSQTLKGRTGVVIRSAEAIAPGLARITAQVSLRSDQEAVAADIQSQLGGQLRVVEGSFTVAASNQFTATVSGVVGAIPQTVAYQEGMDEFKAVAGNMFMDGEEGIWALRQTEAGQILVKTGAVDDMAELNDLLTGVASAGTMVNQYESMTSIASDVEARASVQGGDLITFVSPTTMDTKFGVVVASLVNEDGTDTGTFAALSHDGQEVEVVATAAVVSIHADLEAPETDVEEGNNVAIASGEAKSLEDIAAYYGQMFRKNTAYFEKFMARWKQHNFM